MQHPTYAIIVVASLAQCTAVASKKENVILLKSNASFIRPPSGRAPLTPLPRNARDFRPVFCPYFCYWPAAARHPGFQPLSPPSNLHSPPVQLVPRRTLPTRWFSRWWSSSIISTPTPKAAVVLFIQSTYQNRLVAPFSYPLPLPLSSCLGCIPPLIGLPFLRFYAVASTLFLLFVFSIFFVCLSRRCPLLATFLSVLFCLLSLLSPNVFPV